MVSLHRSWGLLGPRVSYICYTLHRLVGHGAALWGGAGRTLGQDLVRKDQ